MRHVVFSGRKRTASVSVALVLVAELALCVPTTAQQVIQYVSASQSGTALPNSTGQVTDLATCESIITANLAEVPKHGYAVRGKSFLDPATDILITQSCVHNPALFDPAPARPTSGRGVPNVSPVPCPLVTPRTLVLYTFGASNAANNAEARYTAQENAVVLAGANCYMASDPLPGTDGNAGSVWSRIADLLLRTSNFDHVVIIAAAISGTSLTQWMPGGNQHEHMLSTLRGAVAHGFPPSHLLWQGGAGDIETMSTNQYIEGFHAMMASIRAKGISAPVYVAKETVCHIRSANMPADMVSDFMRKGPLWHMRQVIGRQNIRLAQEKLVNGRDMRSGPDADMIGPEFKYDGCHLSRRGSEQQAQMWFDGLMDH
jgi:hypothetical protein